MDDYIGKKFIEKRGWGPKVYKIITFDEEENVYVARNEHTLGKYYTAFSEEDFKKMYFDKNKYLEEINKEIKETEDIFTKYKPIFDKLENNGVFAHNFRGVCEGLKNIEAVQKLVDRYREQIKNSNEDSKSFKNLMRWIKNYEGEISHYKKGIKRNKRVLYRILSKEEYLSLEALYSSTAIEDIYSLNSKLKKLNNEKKEVTALFDKYF